MLVVEVGHLLLPLHLLDAAPRRSVVGTDQPRPPKVARTEWDGLAGENAARLERLREVVTAAFEAYLSDQSLGSACRVYVTTRLRPPPQPWDSYLPIDEEQEVQAEVQVSFLPGVLGDACGESRCDPLPDVTAIPAMPRSIVLTNRHAQGTEAPCGIQSAVGDDTDATQFTVHVFTEERSIGALDVAKVIGSTAEASAPRGPLAARNALRSLCSKRVLMIGAGGIGCEVIKALFLYGFRSVHMVDLDTIDATNLNRQFLFGPEDVGKSKADTARSAVLRWLPEGWDSSTLEVPPVAADGATREEYTPEAIACRDARSLFPELRLSQQREIVAIHSNIKNAAFDVEFFKSFDIVVNGLDNVSARRHVNQLCMAAEVPLVESGTMGYNGQVQPILKGITECYDCHPKQPDQKTFAVCTIHARPTTIVHCIHYAKELYSRLFGENCNVSAGRGDRPDDLAPGPEEHTESRMERPPAADELAYLDGFLARWKSCREAARKDAPREHRWGPCSEERSGTGGEFASASIGGALGEFLFVTKIEDLLKMKSSTVWAGGEPPQPVDPALVHQVSDAFVASLTAGSPNVGMPLLSRDNVLTLSEAVTLFVDAVERCVTRLLQPPVSTSESGEAAEEPTSGVVPFRKDDNVAVDFIAAAANIRAWSFHIPMVSVEEVRGIAGAIIPAIATTNAIAAAGVVQQAVSILLALQGAPKPTLLPAPSMVYIRKAAQVRRRRINVMAVPPQSSVIESDRVVPPRVGCTAPSILDSFLVQSSAANAPCEGCSVCCPNVAGSTPLVHVTVDAAHVTLGALVGSVLLGQLGLAAPSVSLDSNIIYEHEDFESLAPQSLSMWMREGYAASTEPSTGESGVRRRYALLRVDDLFYAAELLVRVTDSPGDVAPGEIKVTGVPEALKHLERAATADEEEEESGMRETPGQHESLASEAEVLPVDRVVVDLVSDEDDGVAHSGTAVTAHSPGSDDDVVIVD